MTALPEEPPQPKDPVAVATTKILAPYLREHGFERLGPRIFGRAKEAIVQWVELVYSPWGGKDFRAFCCTMPMFSSQPEQHELGFGFGGMIEYATEAVTEIKRKLETSEMAWLDEVWDPITFRNFKLAQVPGYGSAYGPLYVSAIIAACVGDMKGARRDAMGALVENERDLERSKAAAEKYGFGDDYWQWHLEAERWWREFIKALETGGHRDLIKKQINTPGLRPIFKRLKGAMELPRERTPVSDPPLRK